MSLRIVIGLAFAAALAGCGSGDAPTTAEGADAQGEIRGGTISDAMLPLDQLKSESPPLKPAAGAGGEPAAATGDDETSEGEAEESDPAAGEGSAQPAAEAAAEADEGE